MGSRAWDRSSGAKEGAWDRSSGAKGRAWDRSSGAKGRAWDRSSGAKERAEQARREDDGHWRGPTYFHGGNDYSGRSKQWDQEQREKYDLYEQQQRRRAARKQARKETERKRSGTNAPPPSHDNAEEDRREDDTYQERSQKEKKEPSDYRKAEREHSEKEGPAELLSLLSNIIGIYVELEKMRAKNSKEAAEVRSSACLGRGQGACQTRIALQLLAFVKTGFSHLCLLAFICTDIISLLGRKKR